MKVLLFMFASFSVTASANELECNAWRQAPEQTYIQTVIPFTGVNSVTGDHEYRTEINGYLYRVDWEKIGNVLRSSVVFNSKAHVFATAIVPSSEAKNISTLDATRDDGERVSIDCMMK